jgi:hypothetical protein
MDQIVGMVRQRMSDGRKFGSGCTNSVPTFTVYDNSYVNTFGCEPAIFGHLARLANAALS